MLKVLGYSASINVRKVLWTCDEIGVAYAREEWGGSRSMRAAEFLALNPNAQVPVIQDGDFVLWESNTICRYLAAKHDRSDLLPSEPARRARVEQWMDWQATELNPPWRYAFYALVRKNPAYADPEKIKASVEEWNRKMAILERQLETTGAYVAGPAFSLADILLGLSVHRWLMTPMSRPDLPAIASYYQRLRERPLFGRYATDVFP
ncbi:MAG TPA: glutathione S-transferase [Dongiaceae bacterium]|jgi:glutathione S-transferase